MTEADWLTETAAPAALLRRVAGKVPARKLRLVACAAWHLVGHHAENPGVAEWVTTAEQFADGCVEVNEIEAAERQAAGVVTGVEWWRTNAGQAALVAAASAVIADFATGADRCVAWVVECATRAAPDGQKQAAAARTRRQVCHLIREVVGNPFRPWAVVPDWLGGGVVQPDGRTVRVGDVARRLAEGIQADQAFDRLPILADALEEGGVTDPELLTHCRGGAGHVRGCWAVDVVLGKV